MSKNIPKMKPKEKRNLERREIERKRYQEILDAAKILFDQKGIENTKMTEIAEHAEIGIASIYRYFKNKTKLVLALGIKYCEEELILLDDLKINKSENGLERMKSVLEYFFQIYKERPQFIRFLEYFDHHMSKKKLPPEKLSEFESIISGFFPLIKESFEIGQKDGSIDNTLNIDEVAMTIIRILIVLTQKLLSRNHILQIDYSVSGDTQILIAVDMILNYIKKR